LLAALEDVNLRFALQATRAKLRDRLAMPASFIKLLDDLRQAAAKRDCRAEYKRVRGLHIGRIGSATDKQMSHQL
jgi:hypothetical protein